MKKIFLLLIFTFSLSFAFSQKTNSTKDNFVGFDIGLVTCVPVYGNTSSPYKNRIIIGNDADISLRIAHPLKILFGYDFIADLDWDKNERANHLDYSVWTGIKVYPGFAGLNASLAYVLGARTDFLNETKYEEDGTKKDYTVTETSAWGNGFKIGLEYDFLYDSNKKAFPAVGFFYRLMPRGKESYDNTFAFYVNMGF